MKKVLVVAGVVLAACMIVFAQGQDRQKVAVYMAGTEPKGALGAHKMVGGELTKAISGSGKYAAIDRTQAILAQLAKEHTYQRTGAVNDAQIKKLGVQFGVQYLCIVEISEVKGGFYLDVRLVDVESAEAVKSATAASSLVDMNEMMRVAQSLAKELTGGAAAAPPPQQTYTPPPQTYTPPQQTYTPPSSSSSGNSFTDSRDGKTYRTVSIGGKTWMAENLNYQTGNSKCYDNNSSNCQKYGRLYDWSTAMDLSSSCNRSTCASQVQTIHQGACPAGWHVPSDAEWTALTNSMGGDKVAGKKLKSKSGWDNRRDGSSGNGTDDYGFSALPGGYCYSGSNFVIVGLYGRWWSATEGSAYSVWARNMHAYRDDVVRGNGHDSKDYLNSVRCVRDN